MIPLPKIKVCGMTDLENMEAVSGALPDYLGFIFYKRSVRYVGEHPDSRLFSMVPRTVSKVAVFVNEYMERIERITREHHFEAVQLHGMESPDFCYTLKNKGLEVIKAIPGDQIQNHKLLGEYSRVADYLLFDTPTVHHGGSGKKFNWEALTLVRDDIPFFLSGGIGPDDCGHIAALGLESLYAVDINSRFETAPGIKDAGAVQKFIKCVRNE